MATFAYEVSPYRRKDGTYLVKIRMTHNRKVLRRPTTIHVRSSQLTRDLSRIKDQGVLDSVNRQLDALRKAEASVEGSEFYPCAELWDAITARLRDGHGFRLCFVAYGMGKTATMEAKTAEGYRSSFRAFCRYLGRDEVDVNEVTYPMLVGFRDHLEAENGKGCRAASYYLGCLRHMHNLARDEYNDEDMGVIRIPRQPFKKGLIPPQPQTEHRVLSLVQLRSLLAFEAVTKRGRLAKDVFVLSFVLLGINTIDLYYAERKDLQGGVLTYNRRKTDSVRSDGALMKVRVEREALGLLERNKGSRLLFGFADRYADHKNFNTAVNIGLKEVGEAIGVPMLNTYYARHTWATLARNECEIPKDVVHEALDHASRGSERVTDIYLERDWSRIWEANRKVLDFVFGRV